MTPFRLTQHQIEARLAKCGAFIRAELRRITRRKTPGGATPLELALRAEAAAEARAPHALAPALTLPENAHSFVARETNAHSFSRRTGKPVERKSAGEPQNQGTSGCVKRDGIAALLRVSRDWLYRNLAQLRSDAAFPDPLPRHSGTGRAAQPVWNRDEIIIWDATGQGDDMLRRARNAHKAASAEERIAQ